MLAGGPVRAYHAAPNYVSRETPRIKPGGRRRKLRQESLRQKDRGTARKGIRLWRESWGGKKGTDTF